MSNLDKAPIRLTSPTTECRGMKRSGAIMLWPDVDCLPIAKICFDLMMQSYARAFRPLLPSAYSNQIRSKLLGLELDPATEKVLHHLLYMPTVGVLGTSLRSLNDPLMTMI